jgi:type IV pilus assembly protein PilP
VPVVKVTEKGREVQYGSPEDFIARTMLSPSEAGSFAERHLADAKRADEAAMKKGDKAQIEHAQADLKLAEDLVLAVKRSALASPGTKIVPYVSLVKRDPFMSPLEVPKAYPMVPPNAPPLERVPSESVVVKAIVWSAKGFRALVITPDGRGYTVKIGDRIGNKGGRIVKISEKRVYVTEKIRDILGDVETRDIVLKLYKEAE